MSSGAIAGNVIVDNELTKNGERLIWIEPIVESLDISATESNWGQAGSDSFHAADSAS